MTPDSALRHQLVLLLAVHGRDKVLRVMAPLLSLTEAELESTLVQIEKAQPKKKPLPADPRALVETLAAQHPDRADALRTLSARFSSKTFLPDLKDVRRFLEARGVSKVIKSRTEAHRHVMEALLTLDARDLQELRQQPERGSYSSLGLISDQILSQERK